MAWITIRDEGRLLQRITHYASAEGLTRSDAIRKLIELGFQTAEQGVLDVRGLVPEIHTLLSEIRERVPKDGYWNHAIGVCSIETTMFIRALAQKLDPKAGVQAQQAALTEVEELKKRGVL